MQDQPLTHQNIVAIHNDLVCLDRKMKDILGLNESDFLACLDQSVRHYYNIVRSSRSDDGTVQDKNLEDLRIHKKCLIHVLERLQDLEAGAAKRHLYHQIIDKALSYVSVRFMHVPSDEVSINGGMIEIERRVVLQNAVLDKSSISLI